MYRFSPFALDPSDQSLLRRSRGKETRIHLPPKAFSVLQMLVEHAGSLVAHNELMERVWPDTFVQPEVLSSHIRDIRAALGDNARKPRFIETASRKGYRFIATVDSNEALAAQQTLDVFGSRLVGRDSEFAKLHQCYRAALIGRRQLVFVTGEPGMGKTALCREFLLRASSAGFPYTAWGQCIEGYGVQEPYFPVLKVIGELCGTDGGALIDVFKAKAPTCIVQFSDLISREERAALDSDIRAATSGRVLREVLDALEAVGELQPLIVVLDDLQWVDHATIDVISEFARRHTPARMLLIGIFRPLEAFLNDNPITVLKEELLAHRLCSEISLPGLTRSDVEDYLSIMTPDSEFRSDLASLLYRRSEGNPLFMVAALEHSVEQGSLVTEDGQLQLRIPIDQLDLDIPQSLKRILEAQIDQLETEERRILEVASVEGSVFSPDVIAAATEHNSQEVEDICHDLATRKQILRATRGHQLADGSVLPCYQFVHVLYRDVLYQRQSPGRRSTRHHLIGTEVERLYKDHLEEVAAEMALHFEYASDWERTVRYLRLAAENSERRYAHREAIALLTRAQELVGRISAGDRYKVELEILERLATIYVACFDSRCVGAYEEVCEKASSFGYVEVSARALLSMAMCLLTQDAGRCLQTAERALNVIATVPDSLLRAQMEMNCNFVIVFAGGWSPDKVDQIRNTFHRIRTQVDRIVLAPQTIQYGIVQWASSEYQESLECLVDGLNALSEEIGEQNPYLSIDYQKAQFYLSRALLFGGQWGQALAVLNASLDIAAKNGDSFPAKILRLNRAWIHFHAMDFNEVIATSEPLETGGDEFGNAYLVRLSRLLSGSAHVALGNRERGLATLLKVREEMDSHTVVYDWCFRLPLLAALTELWLSEADLAQAHSEATRYLTLALNTGSYTYQALAFEVSARVALARGDLGSAANFVSDAIRTIEEREVPLAAWRVHAAAVQLYESLNQDSLTRTHREAAGAAIHTLADSLGHAHPLREIFLSSSAVLQTLTGVYEFRVQDVS